MNKNKLMCLLIFGAVALSAVGFANAPHCHRSQILNCQNKQNCLAYQGEKMEIKNTFETIGEIVSIEEDGLVTVKGKGDYDLISLRIVKNKSKVDNCGNNKATQIYNSDGKRVRPNKLEVGMKVSCYYDTMVSRSYPGQANAKAIIVSKNDPEYSTVLLNVNKVTKNEEKGYVTLEASNNELIAAVGKKSYKYYDQIVEGDEVIIWYGIMTMSLPPRTGAAKAIVL